MLLVPAVWQGPVCSRPPAVRHSPAGSNQLSNGRRRPRQLISCCWAYSQCAAATSAAGLGVRLSGAPQSCYQVIIMSLVYHHHQILPDHAAAAQLASVKQQKQLKVVLHAAAVEAVVQKAYESLVDALIATASTLGLHNSSAAGATEAETTAWNNEEGFKPVNSSEMNTEQWQEFLVTDSGRQLVSSLLSFGSLLCSALPSRYCCNDPSCCCLDKPTELQLAAGKASQCGGCGAARYCGAEDQHKHWEQHKVACKALSAAVKAGKGKRSA